MKTVFDAIIIGAGPAGSTAAILLARAGWSVALVEKQRFPRRKVCGECLAASNLPLLDALGIGAEFIASAGPELRQVALMQGQRTFIADLPAAAHVRHAWGRALGRETLDTLLLEQARASGAVVLQPWSVQALGGAAGDHRCDIRSIATRQAATLQAPVLIAAHGSWEPLPSSREDRRLARRASDLFAFKANFRGATLLPGLLPVLSFSGGYGGMVLADQGLLTLAGCIRADRLEACRRASPGLSAGEAVEIFLKRECRGVAFALGHARREGAWLATGPIDPGIRLVPGDTLFRIGNAAGEAHPIIGEGMSMAMQSAWLLCAQLLRPAEPRRSLSNEAWQRGVHRAYAAEWRRHFAPRLRLAAAFAHLAMRPAVASLALLLLARWPALLTLGARWGGKVSCAIPPGTVAWLASGAGAKWAACAASPPVHFDAVHINNRPPQEMP
ncbi:NAD(P)/FAD-dependent oxidoreductase [Polaromonas hydrogenivorans]|uniref:FAD-dependent oxidoreductase n=1 Tax=Polaromonas hydrogenivorans TaxID=335476 RepID=A0AAU7LVB0_9BURK